VNPKRNDLDAIGEKLKSDGWTPEREGHDPILFTKPLDVNTMHAYRDMYKRSTTWESIFGLLLYVVFAALSLAPLLFLHR
jgi:hypothetical protein